MRPPTLTDVRLWDAGSLSAAATGWAAAAASWENAFTGLADQAALPWEGAAAQRALDRSHGDRLDVLVRAERLRAAADAARRGTGRIEAARQSVLAIVADARARGFIVGEDLTVCTDDPGRRAVGQSVASTLNTRLRLLLQLDRQVATEIISAATGLGWTLPNRQDLPQAPPQKPDPGPEAGGIRVPEDPREFAELWNGLTEQQKEALFAADNAIGNHGGMPFAERDIYNRRHLDQLRASAATQTDQLQTRFDDLAARLYMGDHSAETTGEMHDLAAELTTARRRLDGYQSVCDAMEHNGGVPHLLGLLDEEGHAALSLGDPDTAIRSAVFVPGTGQDMTTLDDNGRRALDMLNAALASDPTLSRSDVAVTTWLGYDRPMTLSEAAWPDRARDGGAALDDYLEGMHASHSGLPAIDTVIGHSYGSTLVGAAATGGHHLAADNVIAVGSPGMLSRQAADLTLDPGARVYSMTAGHDPISLVTSLTLGADPNDSDYGATRLVADPGPALPYSAGLLPGVPAHSSYWDEGNPGLANMGAVIAGRPPTSVLR